MTKTYKVGEKIVCRNELVAEIIAYRRYDDIDVIMEDGKIFEHITYNRFFQGHLYRPEHKYIRWPYRIKDLSNKYLGKKKRTIYGYRTLLRINEDETIDYEDDNGEIIVNGSYFDYIFKNRYLAKYKRRGEIITVIH